MKFRFSTIAFLLAISAAPSAFSSNAIPTDALRAKATQLQTWVQTCPDGTLSHGQFTCPFGDMTIFAGLSCLSGDTARCEDVRRAQGPNGRWWRNPSVIGQGKKGAFSRDQTLGVLAYLVATRDAAAAERWMKWIVDHKGRVCEKDEGQACWISYNLWGLFGEVWRYLGLPLNFYMKLGRQVDWPTAWISAHTTPDGYQVHLVGVDAFIRQELARRGVSRVYGSKWKSVVKKLNKRESWNPFFDYLVNGPTEFASNQILKLCPDQRPTVPFEHDWSWQRSEKDQAWLHSGGYDCLFMIRLLTR